MEKVNIWHTSYFFERYDDAYIFLMMSGYYEEMKNQLEHEGYLENIHIFEMAKVDKSDSWHAINDTRLELHMADVVEGRKLHQRLLREYGENIRILIFASQSMGDVYLMGFYIKEYLKSHDNCLFIFGNKTSIQLAEVLGFGEVLYLPREQVWALINYAKVCGLDKVNIEHLHTSFAVHYRILYTMLKYKGGVDLAGNYRELVTVQHPL